MPFFSPMGNLGPVDNQLAESLQKEEITSVFHNTHEKVAWKNVHVILLRRSLLMGASGACWVYFCLPLGAQLPNTEATRLTKQDA